MKKNRIGVFEWFSRRDFDPDGYIMDKVVQIKGIILHAVNYIRLYKNTVMEDS